VTKAAFNKKTLSTNKLNQNSRNKIVKFLYLEHGFCEVLTIGVRKVDQKYLGSLEMHCWRRIEKIIWNDRKVFQRVQEEMDITQTIKRRKAKWIGHILRRNSVLKHIPEGNRGEGRIYIYIYIYIYI
jgi:hypothetical protein